MGAAVSPLDHPCPVCNVPAGTFCVNLKSGKPLVGSHPTRGELPPPPKPKRVVAVERVVQFKASDGTMHDTYAAAVRASTTAELAHWLGVYIMQHCDHEAPDADHLAAALRNEYTLVRRKK